MSWQQQLLLQQKGGLYTVQTAIIERLQEGSTVSGRIYGSRTTEGTKYPSAALLGLFSSYKSQCLGFQCGALYVTHQCACSFTKFM